MAASKLLQLVRFRPASSIELVTRPPSATAGAQPARTSAKAIPPSGGIPGLKLLFLPSTASCKLSVLSRPGASCRETALCPTDTPRQLPNLLHRRPVAAPLWSAPHAVGALSRPAWRQPTASRENTCRVPVTKRVPEIPFGARLLRQVTLQTRQARQPARKPSRKATFHFVRPERACCWKPARVKVTSCVQGSRWSCSVQTGANSKTGQQRRRLPTSPTGATPC